MISITFGQIGPERPDITRRSRNHVPSGLYPWPRSFLIPIFRTFSPGLIRGLVQDFRTFPGLGVQNRENLSGLAGGIYRDFRGSWDCPPERALPCCTVDGDRLRGNGDIR